MTKLTEIPVIDVAAIHTTDTKAIEDLAAEFYRVYSTAGFGYIVNHGISDSLVERVFSASKRFHALPRDQKMAVELNSIHRGFIPINTSTDVNSKLAEVSQPNQSESFMVLREDSDDTVYVKAGDYLAGKNQWPSLPGFRADVMEYNDAMAVLASRLVGVFSKALGVGSGLVDSFDPPTSWLRLLYYPPGRKQLRELGAVDQAVEDGNYGSAPHTDFGCLTLLAQDDIGGLQVLADDWIDVPRIAGSFVLNVGDMLHRWSNGLLRSTPHRVINTSGKARYSCPFFYDPYVKTNISPLASCVSNDNPARFEPINFGEFLRAELEAGYAHHKEANS